ncbi:MAG TPA: tail fiber protein [Candidatus Limnocylindria bacterium]|jgi:microcystin-dependent protein|nr:tail fiber protein [Candidatus Limnocylindria bacterium]
MSTQFLSEIRIFSFNFAPKNWAMCNGQLLPINTYQPLFALLGTTYGGNGQTTFGLPNLQGRVAMHPGTGYILGQHGGEESHLLSIPEMPPHTHLAHADPVIGDATAANPTNAYPANPSPIQMYSAGSGSMVTMSSLMVSTIGGGQAHENRQPFLTLNFCIALTGLFPTQN